MFLFNGQIISSKNESDENEIIKFDQLNIDLSNLTTTTIKKPKLQETSTMKLINCIVKNDNRSEICKDDVKKEILPTLNRRIVLPLYIPVLSLVCSLMLIKTKSKFLNKISIFIYSFLLLIVTEMTVRYTGINYPTRVLFITSPFFLFTLIYTYMYLKFSNGQRFMNKVIINYILKNFLKTFLIVTLAFYCFGMILNLFEEIEFLKI